MPTYATSQEWLHQSSLLLAARPETTKISTRYTVSPVAARRVPKSSTASSSTPAAADTSKPPRAHLVLRTFDPVSGACLKYKTSKAAEVSRLVQMLGGLGRRQAGLAPRDLDVGAAEESAAAPEVVTSGAATPTIAQQQGQAQGGGGGAKGKKKKGRK